MLTKLQKREQIDAGVRELKDSRTLVFADFSGVKVEDLKKLRKLLRAVSAKFRVFKKRLLRIAFQEAGVDFNPEQFASQLGTVFAESDIFSLAGPIGKLGLVKILGGFDLQGGRFISADEFTRIAQLPSREQLLIQMAVMLTLPIRKLMLVLKGRAKVISE